MTPIRQSFLIGLEPPHLSPPPLLHVIHSGTLREVGKGGGGVAEGVWLPFESFTHVWPPSAGSAMRR